MMEPASNIVRKLGGPAVVSRICGVHRTRVSNWMRSREKGGTGGMIPHWHMRKLLAHAREHGLNLEPSDFVEHLSADDACPGTVGSGEKRLGKGSQ